MVKILALIMFMSNIPIAGLLAMHLIIDKEECSDAKRMLLIQFFILTALMSIFWLIIMINPNI